jgi:hypothetical protein
LPVQSFGPESTDNKADRTEITIELTPASPTSIDLGSDLVVPAEFRSQYERWQSGEIDLGEIESVVSEVQRELLIDQSLQLEPNNAIQDLDMAQPAATVLEVGFDSLDISQCCGKGSNVPPDPELAVGPRHVVAAVNVAFEIYDKSGNVLIPATTFAALFSGEKSVDGCTESLFDPNVLYDEQANRFILAIDGGAEYYCLAVSQTDDPTGAWWRYRFPANFNDLSFDYPQAGVGRDAIYMGGNMFFPGDGFAEARVWAFDKWAMYAGVEARVRTHTVRRSSSNAPEEDTPQPAHLHGYAQGTWPKSGPHYILTETDFNGATYSVYQWRDPFGEDRFSFVGTFDLERATGIDVGMPVPVPQDESFPLMTNDWRLQDAEYRNGFIWTTDTVACNRDGQTLNCIRWAQIDPTTAKVIQAGVSTSDGRHRFYGDIAANSCNDMAVGYTKMGDNRFAGAWITGRLGSQAPGILHGETRLKAGELTYTAFDGLLKFPPRYRWGDYTGMTNDPNGRDFWYIGQYSKDTQDQNGSWGTYIGCFIAASCAPQSNSNIDQQSSLTPLLPGGAYTITLPIVSKWEYYPCGEIFD